MEKKTLDEEITDKECHCQGGEEDTCNDDCQCGEECNCNDDSNSECACDDCGGHVHGQVDENNYNETTNELEMLQRRLLELDSKAKYAQAELVNYRKRKDEEVSNMLKFANQDLIMEIISIIDNFERAFKLNNENDERVAGFLEGFKMLYVSLVEVLKKYGVEEMDALGKEFDPNLHLALLTDKDKTKENDIILDVMLKGYTLKGKMIRPASVKVNKLK